MAMQAAGAYLAALRSRRGYTQEDVAKGLNVSTKSVQLWEGGRKTPSSLSLAALVRFVDGNPDDVHALLLDDTADAEVGRARAYEWLRKDRKLKEEVDRLVTETDPIVLREVVEELIQEYEQHPVILDRLRAWLEGWRSRSNS
jgi:transcriptional regulator with XRE-family HTH domain